MTLIPKSGDAYAQIEPLDILSPEEIKDEAALQLVVQCAAKADAYLQEKLWPTRWQEIDTLYQNPRRISAWEGTQVQEASVPSFTIAKHVNAVVPQCVSGLFYQDPPFLLRPRPGTDESVVRAKTAVFSAQLDETGFESQVSDGWFYTALFGTAIYKWGWLSDTRIEKRYVRKATPPSTSTPFGDVSINTEESDEFEVKEITKKVERPVFEHVDVRHVLVDPGCRVPDIRKARWVIHRMYLTYEDLDALRGVEGWDIPSEEILRAYFEPPVEQAILPGQAEMATGSTALVPHAKPRYEKTSADPLSQPLKVEEYWDKDSVVAVLQDKLVIRNEANPFSVIPFYSSHWWRIPDSFYSIGIGYLVSNDQRVQQGLRNSALNILGLSCNPSYLRSRGANVPTQQIRQRRGGIIDVDGDVDKAFRMLETPKVPPEVWAALQNSQAESESTSAADTLLVQGSSNGAGRTSMKSATTANTLSAASASRIQDPVARFIKNVFEPWLYQMDELDRERLPMSVLRDLLADELGKDFKVDEEDYLNAKLEYEVLAGAHLSAKRAMQQALPLMIQLFENPQLLAQLSQTGWTIDVRELFEMLLEVSEWKNGRNIVRRLDDEERQHMQSMNPRAAKLKGQMLLQSQQAEQQAALQRQKTDSRAEETVMRHMIEQIETPEVIGDVANG